MRRCATSWMSAGRRLFAAAEARAVGYGGLAAVARATGMARGTIGRGLKDLDRAPLPRGRVRRDGERAAAPEQQSDPTLLEDLRRLIEPVTLGDPMRPLLWVSKSHEKLAAALRAMGHTVSPNTVRKLLRQLGYSRQANRKANDGRQPCRPRRPVRAHQCPGPRLPGRRSAGDLGRHQEEGADRQLHEQGARDYRPEGQPRRTEVHDFENKDLGKVVPYGVYDLADNSGWVSVGHRPATPPSSRSTPSAAGLSKMGRERYPARIPAADHRRLRRLQWCPRAAVEARTADAGRRDRADDHGVPLSRPAPRSGTRSSTGSSATSRKTDTVGHFPTLTSCGIWDQGGEF